MLGGSWRAEEEQEGERVFIASANGRNGPESSNYGKIKNRILCHIHSFLASKRIELESPATSYIEENFKGFPTLLYFLIFH